jgi:hypothetical protein
VPRGEPFEARVRDAADGGKAAPELHDLVARRPREERRARHVRGELAQVLVRAGEARPGVAQDRRDLRAGRDDAAAMLRRGPALQDHAVVERVGGGKPARAARARREEAHHRRDRPGGERVTRVEPARILENEAGDARRIRGRDADRGRAADRVADEDDAIEAESIEKARDQRRVARGARRHAVVARAALSGPVHRDDAVAIAERGRESLEVAGAVPDRVQADDRQAAAGVVVREADAVDRRLVRAGATGKACGCHSD